jgi:hypothetical protein
LLQKPAFTENIYILLEKPAFIGGKKLFIAGKTRIYQKNTNESAGKISIY